MASQPGAASETETLMVDLPRLQLHAVALEHVAGVQVGDALLERALGRLELEALALDARVVVQRARDQHLADLGHGLEPTALAHRGTLDVDALAHAVGVQLELAEAHADARADAVDGEVLEQPARELEARVQIGRAHV